MLRRYTKRNTTIIDWEKANSLYAEGLNYIEIVKNLSVPMSVFTRNAPNHIDVRSKRNAQINARQRGKGIKHHTSKTKEKLRQIALQATYRRLKKKTYNYRGIILDSTWEVKLAQLLDKMHVKWVRPEPIPWTDKTGVKHNYFPDFLLIDYNMYLDPKNEFAKKVQKEKITILLDKYRNIIIMRLQDINEEFISNILSSHRLTDKTSLF